jgi:hypothetical protein
MTQLIPTWTRHPMRTFTLLLFLLALSFGCRGQDKPNPTQAHTPQAAPPPKAPVQGFHFGYQNINTEYVYYSDGQQFTDSIALKTLYYDKAPYIPKGIPGHNNYEPYGFVLYSLEDLTWAQKKQAFGDMFAGNRAFQDSLKTAAFCTQSAIATPAPGGLIVRYSFVLYGGSLRYDSGYELLSETTYQWYNSKFGKGKSLTLPHALEGQMITKDGKYMLIKTCIARFGDSEISLPGDIWLMDVQNARLLGKLPVSSGRHWGFNFKYDDKKNIYYTYLIFTDKYDDQTRKFMELIVFDPSDGTFYSKILDMDVIDKIYNKETGELPVPEWSKADLKGFTQKKLL